MASGKTGREDRLIEGISKEPSEKNWNLFKKRMAKDKARYYHVVYPREVKSRINLKSAYVVLYDSKYRQLYRVPIIRSDRKGIEGVMINFKGLEVNRRVMR